MFRITCQDNSWQIIKNGNVVLSGFATEAMAILTCRLYGAVLTDFYNLKT